MTYDITVYLTVRCTGCNQKLIMNKTFRNVKSGKYPCVSCNAAGRPYKLVETNLRLEKDRPSQFRMK